MNVQRTAKMILMDMKWWVKSLCIDFYLCRAFCGPLQTGQFKMPTAGARPPPNDVTALSRDREPPEAQDDLDTSSCRYEFVSSATLRSGRVYSPRYPRNFPPDVDCVYQLRARGHQEKVVISLLSVRLGQTPGLHLASRYSCY